MILNFVITYEETGALECRCFIETYLNLMIYKNFLHL